MGPCLSRRQQDRSGQSPPASDSSVSSARNPFVAVPRENSRSGPEGIAPRSASGGTTPGSASRGAAPNAASDEGPCGGTTPRSAYRRAAPNAASDEGPSRGTAPRPASGGTTPRSTSRRVAPNAASDEGPSRGTAPRPASGGTTPRSTSRRVAPNAASGEGPSREPGPRLASERTAPGSASRRAAPEAASDEGPSRGTAPRSASERTAPGSTSEGAIAPHQIEVLSELKDLDENLVRKIFFLSLEPNLARTSKSLNRTLSKESIYKTLILYAFFQNDEQTPVNDSHFAPDSYRYLTANERLRLQKGILDCQWCTYERIRRYIPNLMRLELEKQWNLHHQTWPDDESLPRQNDIEGLRAFFQGKHEHMQANQICTTIRPPSTSSNPRPRNVVQFDYIPHRALNPRSWDNGAADYLLFVRQHLRSLSNAKFSPVELIKGIRKAIYEHNRQALYLLILIHYHRARARPPSVLDVPLPADLFNLAYQQSADYDWILELLVAGNFRTLPAGFGIGLQRSNPAEELGSEIRIWIRRQIIGGDIPPWNLYPPLFRRERLMILREWTGPIECPIMDVVAYP
jgi:hypothetical protein